MKNIRIQKPTYIKEEKELTKEEYIRLLNASKEQEQLNLVLQTICATGIRVSELKYFTTEAVLQGEVNVRCKNKTRTILIPRKLKKLILDYMKKKKIEKGNVFITRTGKPLDRSYRAYIVTSDSMSESDLNATDAVHFSAGDLIFVKYVTPSTLQVGDIITYQSQGGENFGETITHKIRALTVDAEGNPGFITYGTNTGVDDEIVVTYPYVLGKYQGKAPNVGHFFIMKNGKRKH